ncbi:MAG: hypothetical protein IT581_22620 [Verrucomicrobiales bacterium]|nr:hypothetical protein [Verrucomicrobiales bacterium]
MNIRRTASPRLLVGAQFPTPSIACELNACRTDPTLMNPLRLALLLSTLVAPASPLASAAEAPPDAKPFSGRVVETMDAGGYTYVLVEHGQEKTWVASRAFAVQTGDNVQIPGGWVMKDFQSTTLDRKFEWILFAPRVANPNRPTAVPAETQVATTSGTHSLPSGHPQLPDNGYGGGGYKHPSIASAPIEIPKNLQPPQGGQKIVEYLKDPKKHTGRTVAVRGVVVKYSEHILGRNWLHVRDGSGPDGSSDLVITTKEAAAPGDLVTARGKLTRDRDFGAGYRFAVLVEDADVKVEKAAAGAGETASK